MLRKAAECRVDGKNIHPNFNATPGKGMNNAQTCNSLQIEEFYKSESPLFYSLTKAASNSRDI